MRDQFLPPQPPTRNGEDSGSDRLFIQSLGRAADVLSAFHQTDKPLSLQDISDICGLGRSAVQRIVHTFKVLGYIERDPDDRGYVPGLRLLDHTLDFQRLNPIVVKATPILLELRRTARERVDLSLRDDLRLVYASRLQSKREILSATMIGHSVPIYCTSGGRAILAHLDDPVVDDIIARSNLVSFTPKTLTAPEDIRAKVEETRRQGYSVCLEEVLTGEIAIGAAIFGTNRQPVAAIHVAGSLAEWEPETFCQQFAPLLIQAAKSISRL